MLVRSHILPEFLYKPIYDPDHRFGVVSSDVGLATYRIRKGVREYLLCEECERLLSKHETVVANEIRCIMDTICQNPGIERYDAKVSYLDWRLCILSIMLRVSLSRRDRFVGIEMGLEHETNLKNMLIEGNPGDPLRYAMICACPLLWPGDAERKPDRRLILFPSRFQFADPTLFWFLAHGLMFWVYLSSDAPPPYLAECTLRPDASWPIVIGDAERNPLIFGPLTEIGAAEQHRRAGGA